MSLSKWPVLGRLKQHLPSLPQRPVARIALAIGLSLLVHAIVLFAPLVELPKSEVPLPPLTAKLEPLPKTAAPPAPKKKPQPKPKPVKTETSPLNTPVTEAISEEPQIDAEPQPSEEVVEETVEQAKPPLPKHAQLTFSVYQGNGGMQLGEAVHQLDIEEGQYILKTVTQTTGVVSFFKTYLLTQTSRGRVDARGLQPQSFAEEKKLSGGSQSLSAEFDWEAHKLHFSHGGETGLPEQAQDILSFLYQLSRMPANREIQPLSISNGKKLEHYELEIGAEEEIETPLGKLRALPLRKLHAKGEEGLDIWLGLEYRLLPVKIRQIDRTGQVAGEMVISDIRVSDE